VVICCEITTNSAVHSRPGFQSYGRGWVPDSTDWISDSRDWIPDSKALDSGFQVDSGFRIPDSLTWGDTSLEEHKMTRLMTDCVQLP